MADTIGFEIDVSDVSFGTTGVSSSFVPSSPGFVLQEPEIFLGSVVAFFGPVPSLLGFPFQDSAEIWFGDTGISSRNVPRSAGFSLELDVVDYKKPGDTAYEIYPSFPELISDNPEVEVNTGDIRIEFIDGVATMTVSGGDLLRDAGLETALLISLFSDQRSTLDEVKAAGLEDTDLRGWWGDTFEEEPIGSRIWLLSRAKMVARTLTDFREYTLQSWQWLLDDGVAKGIEATVVRYDKETILLSAIITKPDGTEETFRYYINWQAQLARRA